ncbi:MAG: HAMP domain-containing histidine kinase [Phycisphaerales bacterium]|nr:HAMP domain-containing histidine kinase [Phycisphaerales bacterium]
MNTRRVWTWIVFWVGVCVVIAALSWASVSVSVLETHNSEARARAQRQELIQRALWRIDSRIAPIIALESSRPYSDYDTFQTEPPAWTRGVAQNEAGENATPQSYATQYFQLDSGSLDQAQSVLLGGVPSELDHSQEDTVLKTDSDSDGPADVYSVLSEPMPSRSPAQTETAFDYQARKAIADLARQNTANSESSPSQAGARARDQIDTETVQEETTEAEKDELPIRMTGAISDSIGQVSHERNELMTESLVNALGVRVGGLDPRWMTDDNGVEQLVLVRTIERDGKSIVQGVWLDWSSLRADLIGQIRDIMPGASIVPSTQTGEGYPLATIPAVLLPTSAIGLPERTLTPAMAAMLMTWIAILATIAAIGLVLRAALNLSDRRGRFVTAVTHELRTPLTTFRLYSQMLADGMVPDDTVRAQYLGTLKRESERLTGIVENVLEYARLSRRRSVRGKAAGVQTLTPDALVVRFRPALSRRAGQSNMDLVTSIDLAGHESRTVTADPNAVERIMLNLVENACKYAAVPEGLTPEETEEFDTRIHLDVSVTGGMLELLVADHGPGIDPADRGRVFGEFQRGSRRRDLDRSGLGLGLALSRGLAREMGGELELVQRRRHGAEFLLRIPLDEPMDASEGRSEP